MRTRTLGLALGVSLLAAAPVVAQQGTSEIGGKVTDQQGAAIAKVSVVATETRTGAKSTAVS